MKTTIERNVNELTLTINNETTTTNTNQNINNNCKLMNDQLNSSNGIYNDNNTNENINHLNHENHFNNNRNNNKNNLTTYRKYSLLKWFRKLYKNILLNDHYSLNSKWQMRNLFYYRTKFWQRKQLLIILSVGVFLIVANFIINYFNDDEHFEIEMNENAFHLDHLHSHVPGMKGYLVWSERCKMPNVDPYQPEIMKHFRREKYKTCKTSPPLTYTEFNETTKHYILRIDGQYRKFYSKTEPINCCYQIIERNGTGLNADKGFSLSKCLAFWDKTPLASTIDNILVRCHTNNGKDMIYINGHSMMPERQNIQKRLRYWSLLDGKYDRKRAISVLMLGIDSISRLNLIRAMPKTAQYLYDNEWFELSGYNKIDDNTFPNLMAILTGMNKSEALRRCNPTGLGGLDKCDFIWRTFRRYGYVTAYAEDEASINTFNYLKAGFIEPPTDYYLRPFLLCAEKHLKIKYKSKLAYCLGHQHSVDYVYDYALELAKRYRNATYFGLFWTNTFSHNDISDATSMDGHMLEYLQRFHRHGILEDTIIIFFSDHGMRYGPTRNTYSGHLEERLPFMFIWLPDQLKHQYPSFVSALTMNKNRLTNPYDIHMTLKHIISLSGRMKSLENNNRTETAAIASSISSALACPKCHSLFLPVLYNRSCDDVAIEAHWCTCLHYQTVDKDSKTIIELGHLLVQYINNYVANFQNKTFAKLCVPLSLKRIENAYLSSQSNQEKYFPLNISNTTSTSILSILSYDIYRVTFLTDPNDGLFEATALYNPDNGYMKVTGEISRLNSYITDSACVSDGGAKKYCSCHSKRLLF